MADNGVSSGRLSTGHRPGPEAVPIDVHHPRPRDSLPHGQIQLANPSALHQPPHSPRGTKQPADSHYAGDQISPTYSSSGSSAGGNHTTSPAMQDQFEIPPAKRQKVSDVKMTSRLSESDPVVTQDLEEDDRAIESSPSPLKGNTACRKHKAVESRQESESLEPGPPLASATMSKPRRVRTGCLTCRNRHLKCDEALPICLNCQKSNRKCERGVRLNFIDLKVEQPPYLLPPVDWKGELYEVFPSAFVSRAILHRLGLLPARSHVGTWFACF